MLDQQLKNIVVVGSHRGLSSSKVYNKVVYAIIDAKHMQGIKDTFFRF
jgi:hypothetical protein